MMMKVAVALLVAVVSLVLHGASLAQPVDSTPSPAHPVRNAFGDLERHVGRQYIGVQQGQIIELQRLDGGELVVQLYSHVGEPAGRYVFQSHADGTIQVTEAPFADVRKRWGSWQGRRLFVGSSTGRFLGGRNRYHSFSAEPGGIAVMRAAHTTNAFGGVTDEGYKEHELYVPVTEALVAASAEAQVLKRERVRLQERQRREQAENSARIAHAAMEGFARGLGEAQVAYEQQDRQQAEFLRDTEEKVRAVETYRRTQQQRQDEQRRLAARSAVAGDPVAGPSDAPTAPVSAGPASATTPAAGDATGTPDASAAKAQAEQQARMARERDAAARQASLEAARRKQEATWQDYLQSEMAGIRLRAMTCPGGEGRYFVGGTRPTQKHCVKVQYEARCEATPNARTVRGTLHNFVGGASCAGDLGALEGSLACPVEQVRVDVLQVDGCN